MATAPRGQRASACVGGRARLALMCVDSWNSVGPLLSVSAQSGTKTETECGGRCCLVGVKRMLSRSEYRGSGVCGAAAMPRMQPKGRRMQPKRRRMQPKGRRMQPKGRRMQPKGRRMQPKGRRACSRRGAACPCASAAALRPGARPAPPPSRGTSCRQAAPSPQPRCPAAPLVALARVRVRATNPNLPLALTPRCPASSASRLRARHGASGLTLTRPADSPEASTGGRSCSRHRLPRPASAHQPHGPRWPVTLALFFHMASRLKASEAGSCTCSHRCGRRFCIFLGVSAAIF